MSYEEEDTCMCHMYVRTRTCVCVHVCVSYGTHHPPCNIGTDSSLVNRHANGESRNDPLGTLHPSRYEKLARSSVWLQIRSLCVLAFVCVLASWASSLPLSRCTHTHTHTHLRGRPEHGFHLRHLPAPRPRPCLGAHTCRAHAGRTRTHTLYGTIGGGCSRRIYV